MSSHDSRHVAVHVVKEALHSKTGHDVTNALIGTAATVGATIGVPAVVAVLAVPAAIAGLTVWGIWSIFKD